MFFPFNFIFTYNIYSKKYLALFFDFLRTKVIKSYDIMDILLLIFIIGTTVSLILFLQKQYKFYHLIRMYPYSNSSEIQNIIYSMQLKRKIKCDIKVIQLNQIQSPCITGLINPIIILPCIDFTDEELQYIFNHELEHYYHHDLWFKLICELMLCFYWWHPLAHQLKKQLNATLEFSNDFVLASDMDEKKRLCYIECLIKIARYTPVNSCTSAIYFSSTPSSVLTQRANFILDQQKTSRNKLFHYTNVCIIASLIFVSLFFVFEPEYPIPPEIENTTVALEKNKTFFVKHNNVYMTYYNGKAMGTLKHIDDFKGYRIYTSLTEAKKHEKFK
ncbi:MAG: M56 family metallopeptidase [Anaerostipes sp.]|nr:M56 family metallopeptidase [Anaerostipes sp.]MDD3745429.1 M56 family metallopeptidase [Anaerostipes sp.]